MTSLFREVPSLPQIPLIQVDVAAGPARHWARDLSDRWNIGTRFEVCRPVGPGGTRLLQVAELTGSPGDLAAAEQFLRHRDDLTELTLMVLSPSRRFLRAVSEMPASCRRVIEEGAMCASCQFVRSADGGESDRWSLVVPRSSKSLKAVASAPAGPKDASRRILRIRRFVPTQSLTPRQATALETAYRLGYYEFPRRTNLTELSRILGVKRSSASELLRRAESRMLSPHLGKR